MCAFSAQAAGERLQEEGLPRGLELQLGDQQCGCGTVGVSPAPATWPAFAVLGALAAWVWTGTNLSTTLLTWDLTSQRPFSAPVPIHSAGPASGLGVPTEPHLSLQAPCGPPGTRALTFSAYLGHGLLVVSCPLHSEGQGRWLFPVGPATTDQLQSGKISQHLCYPAGGTPSC